MTPGETHDQIVRQQFSQQASRFEPYVTAQGNRDVLSWILGNLRFQPDWTALDVAAGTGLVARKIAPQVQRVVALDATPDMLAQGRTQAQSEGISNIIFEEGDARSLPYPDGAFDLVTCRLGMHHFENPAVQLCEMVRVCRPGGQVAVIDITTSGDEAAARVHNRLETLRDPSHTCALTEDQLRLMVEKGGLEVFTAAHFDAQRSLDDWVDLTDTGPDARRVIIGELERELEGGSATGMRPYMSDDVLMFVHSWVMLVGRKASV